MFVPALRAQIHKFHVLDCVDNRAEFLLRTVSELNYQWPKWSIDATKPWFLQEGEADP